MHSVKDELLRKVRMAAKVRVVRTASRLALTLQGASGNAAPAKPSPAVRTTPAIPADQRFPVVVLGASTGGPPPRMRPAPRLTPHLDPERTRLDSNPTSIS